MKLLIASNNKGKIREIKSILGRHFDDVISLSEAGISLEVEEDGDTFEQNAMKKAVETMRLSGMPSLADDSGLAVDALDGAPGVYSARYAGTHGSDEANNSLLLKNMEGVPRDKRGCAFVCCIAVAMPDGRTATARGECRGVLTDKPAGGGGFGYDPLFFCEEYGCTFGELDPEIKNGISHRANALNAISKELERLLSEK